MKTSLFLFSILGAGLTACSSLSVASVDAELLPMDSTISINPSIEERVQPYRDSMEQEMNEVIAVAENDFMRGRPNGNLNNWVADAVYDFAKDKFPEESIHFCLLNFGGIRTTINKGKVTIGDMFKVLPFDNEVVLCKLPIQVLPEIEAYLKESGGEPLAHAEIVNGNLAIDEHNGRYKHFWVVTSDYLFRGGDNMTFFTKQLEVKFTGELMRDVMIEAAKQQKVLVENAENRIQF